MLFRLFAAVRLCALLVFLAASLLADDMTTPTIIQWQSGGNNVLLATGFFKVNFQSGCTATNSDNT
jgi:hypothetical protein